MPRRFWIPILLSIPITVVAILAAFSVVWLDPGPIPDTGNRWGFVILFPFTILAQFLRRFDDGNTDFFFIAPALIQFPVYGLALATANLKGKLRSTLIALLALHLLTITITLLAARFLRPPTQADFYLERNPTTRWTGAAGVCFASNLVRRRLNEIAPPGQL